MFGLEKPLAYPGADPRYLRTALGRGVEGAVQELIGPSNAEPECALDTKLSSVLVECLAEELKRLIGWGCSHKRLPFAENLRSLANAPSDAKLAHIGFVMRRYLIQAIDSLSETIEFYDKQIPPEKMRRALRLLLQVEGSGLSAVERRGRAIMVLGLPCAVDQFRRPYGIEYELMILLAEHLVRKG